jgi:hypothetical protein
LFDEAASERDTSGKKVGNYRKISVKLPRHQRERNEKLPRHQREITEKSAPKEGSLLFLF